MAHDGPVLGSTQIEINHLMKGAAMQQAQNFRQRKARSDGAHERCADGLSSQKRDPTTIKDVLLFQLLVSRLAYNLFRRLFSAPQIRGRPWAGQRVQPYGPKVPVSAAQTCF